MIVIKALAVVIVNLIIYFAFGSLVTVRRRYERSLILTVIVGFFAYYGLFAVVTLPIMLTYRPLSMLTGVWLSIVCAVIILAAVLNFKAWKKSIPEILSEINRNKGTYIAVGAVTVICVICVCITYNFTLDAAYYVANVTTGVDTNMINVYDPFTGAWQDHFELRYVFATYSVNDAVVCALTGIPALVQTKTVMSALVMILVNLLYVYICRFFYRDNRKSFMAMYGMMIFINLMFITLYSASNFLMSRTYEGKSVVGNIAVLAIFAVYLLLCRKRDDKDAYRLLFWICFGTATVSSTANMIIPAECFVLFVPYIFKNRKFGSLVRLGICILPELVMMLMYVLYVKGYFAIYTYPR